MILTTLQQIGLSEKQAKIYLAALELGETTIKEIAKHAGLKRTTLYDLMDEMTSSGFLKQTVKGTRKKIIAASPEELKIIIQKREALLAQILPSLSSLSNVEKIRPKIRFYEGKDGLKEVYADTLNYSGEMLAFASEDVVKILGMDWAADYLKKRARKKLRMRAIVPKTALVEKDFVSRDQEQLRSTKLVDAKKYPFSTEINIYGHQKIALMSSKEEVGLIIEGAEIHNTLKYIFELLWDNLPEIKIQ